MDDHGGAARRWLPAFAVLSVWGVGLLLYQLGVEMQLTYLSSRGPVFVYYPTNSNLGWFVSLGAGLVPLLLLLGVTCGLRPRFVDLQRVVVTFAAVLLTMRYVFALGVVDVAVASHRRPIFVHQTSWSGLLVPLALCSWLVLQDSRGTWLPGRGPVGWGRRLGCTVLALQVLSVSVCVAFEAGRGADPADLRPPAWAVAIGVLASLACLSLAERNVVLDLRDPWIFACGLLFAFVIDHAYGLPHEFAEAWREYASLWMPLLTLIFPSIFVAIAAWRRAVRRRDVPERELWADA